MKKYSPLLVCGFAMLAIPRLVCAEPITLVSSSRSILVSATAGNTSVTTPLFDQKVLSNSIGAIDSQTAESAFASAFLSSSVTASIGVFSGHGTTAAGQDSSTVQAGGHAQASFAVTFDLNEAQRFDFGANFTSTSSGTNTTRSLWETQLFFGPPSPNPMTAFDFSGSGGQTLSRSGILLPGRYGFFLNGVSDSFGSGTGRTDLDYTFALRFSDPQGPAPVPEPTSLLLLGSGLIAVVRSTARRACRERHPHLPGHRQ